MNKRIDCTCYLLCEHTEKAGCLYAPNGNIACSVFITADRPLPKEISSKKDDYKEYYLAVV